MTMHSEIFEQPERLAHLLQNQRDTTESIAAAVHRHDIHYVFLAARGTSDNAGRYANYLWGAQNNLPLALATPSLFTYYQQPPRLDGAGAAFGGWPSGVKSRSRAPGRLPA